MDAVEFMKESNRMCKAFNDTCKSKDGSNFYCGFYCGLRYEANKNGESCDEYIRNHPDKAVAIVEKWAKEHPRKTRQSEFLKMFPNAQIFKEILTINPCMIDSSRFGTEECHAYDDNNAGCFECRKKYWTEEIE